MGQQEPISGSRRFGTYLRRVREGRKLSLDAVEELSSGYPERITKSHLSRIENGQALPSFPRLFALGRIYGVPVSSLAERFEVEFQREPVPGEQEQRTDAELLEESKRLRHAGRYAEALSLYTVGLDRSPGGGDGRRRIQFQLGQIVCLVHLNRFELAKGECEELLGTLGLDAQDRLKALELFTICCYRLSRFAVAMMGLDQARRELDAAGASDKMRADVDALLGHALVAAGRPGEAVSAFRTALEGYEKAGNGFEACRSRINLAGALIVSGGRQDARVHLEPALATSEAAGYERQRAIALSHLALLALEDRRLDQAESLALRSNALAREREYLSLVFRNCYFLWKIALVRGDAASAKANERALRVYLSRVEEYLPEAEAFRAYMAGGQA